MPQRVSVVSLELLTVRVISKFIETLCNNDSLSVYDLAGTVSHFKLLPPQYQAEICKIFIEDLKKRSHKDKVNERHLFFCAHLNSEEFYVNEFERNLLFLKLFREAQFKKLTFSGPNFPFPETDVDQTLRFRTNQPLYDFILSLRNLTVFHSVRMCDDYMFQLFSEYCPHLEEIEVELCYTLSDEGICYLCGFNSSMEVQSYLNTGELTVQPKGCKNLKKVIFDFTMVSSLSVAALLKWCTQLETLNVSPDINWGEVFTMLHGFDSYTYDRIVKRYNLISIRSSMEIEESVLSLIVETCPNLRTVAIRCYGSERKDKNLLANLLKLSVHSLEVINCHTESLLWYLCRRGKMLRMLCVEHLITAPQNVYLNRSHLQHIINNCPKLHYLVLKMCGNVTISPNLPYSSFGNNLKYFTTLKKLYIDGANLEPDDIKVLISRNNKIEEINLMCQSLEALEDALLYELLSSGSLKNLKNFFVFRPFLTYAGLQRLLAECPHLEKVGPLSSWAIPKHEREKLMQEIKKNNWALNIESPETYNRWDY